MKLQANTPEYHGLFPIDILNTLNGQSLFPCVDLAKSRKLNTPVNSRQKTFFPWFVAVPFVEKYVLSFLQGSETVED